MSREYRVEYFQTGQGATGHSINSLQDILNEYGKSGWRLVQMPAISVGFMLVFERDVSP